MIGNEILGDYVLGENSSPTIIDPGDNIHIGEGLTMNNHLDLIFTKDQSLNINNDNTIVMHKT